MRFLPATAESRRAFFRAAARYSLLAALTAAAGWLERSRVTGNRRCTGRSFCTECAALAGCGLPQALSTRQRLQSEPGKGDT